MSEKGGNIFEEHIEKIALAIVGLVCLWLLITRVLISPNVISYDNKEFGSGDIDIYISKQAELLEDKLNRRPKPAPPYDPCFPGFSALIDLSIPGIDASLHLPQPRSLMQVRAERAYRIPLIGEVSDVGVEHIRAVAYVPAEEIDEENAYGQDGSEPNDIDFVTVEAKFNVAGLYERFYESFAGEDIQEDWRDPCLAKPVFAAVQLQRRELLADGRWSDWQIVPRTRINHRKKMFDVIEDVNKLPVGGIKVRLLQFDNPEVRMDLLQPEAYMIASAEEEWFPPSLHKKYVEYQRVIEAEEKREAREAEREEREREREEARAERSRRTESRGSGVGRDDTFSMEDFFGAGSSSGRSSAGRSRRDHRSDTERSSRRTRYGEYESDRELPAESVEDSKPTSIGDIEDELDGILITAKTDLSKMREPLVFWAHDDTVEPGESYRYKTRLGVFNPIGGTNQFSEQDKSQKNKVILWSEFSDETETVETPGRLYFFCRRKHEAAKTVTIQVSRYMLGYWYSEDFTVKHGEVIGKVVEFSPEEEEEEGEVTFPETIDYTTGAVLVDVIPVNDWSGVKKLRRRHYFDMLYSFDGTSIEHTPIESRYWAEQLLAKFNEIRKSEKEPKQTLRDWGSRPSERRVGPRPGIEEFEDFTGEEFEALFGL